MPGHADSSLLTEFLLQPIHGSQDLLYFVPNQVAAHLVGHSVEPLPVGAC